MGWQDRPYYRDGGSGPMNPLMWLVSGSVSLGTWFGIRVRVHASMVLFVALMLLFRGLGTWHNTLTAMAILFVVVLLHEFGHCFGSRLVGGQPTEILMHPLGGLAFAGAPHRPWAQFVTVLCGPLVNVLICLAAAAGTALITGTWRVLPWNPMAVDYRLLLTLGQTSFRALYYLWWVFGVSYAILLFNLWPVFPLDGGQLLQSVLWAKIGYYRATIFASITGMVGAVFFAGFGLVRGNLFILFLAIWGFQYCFLLHRELKANGPWAYQDEDYGFSGLYGGSGTATARKRSARKLRKSQRLEREAAAEQEQIDAILAKVSAHGMQSLSWWEKRALRKATERQRKRDAQLSRSRR
jgi:stage IV sporulation protein FB